MLTVLLGVTGALTYGAADFFGGLAARRSATLIVTAGVAFIGLAGISIASLFVTATPSDVAWLYGAASGLAGAVGIGLLYGSLAIGPMSILSPATAFISAIVPVSVGLAAGEGSGVFFFVALFFALLAVILVGFVPEQGAVRPRPIGLLMAAGSGTLIGLGIILINATPDDSGLIPLVANRVASSTMLALALMSVILYRRGKGKTPALPGFKEIQTMIPLVVGAGFFDVLANVVVLYGLRSGDLSVMSVLVALYPAGTILLAAVVLKERIALVQWFGLGLALIASALLAL
jgi:uncharacterized membrane protein